METPFQLSGPIIYWEFSTSYPAPTVITDDLTMVKETNLINDEVKSTVLDNIAAMSAKSDKRSNSVN